MSWTHERTRIASLTLSRTRDDDELADARCNYGAERLAEYVARVVSHAPPLSTEQLDRIVCLLKSGEPR